MRLHEVLLRREAVVPAADSTLRPPIRESAPLLAALNAAAAKGPHSP